MGSWGTPGCPGDAPQSESWNPSRIYRRTLRVRRAIVQASAPRRGNDPQPVAPTASGLVAPPAYEWGGWSCVSLQPADTSPPFGRASDHRPRVNSSYVTLQIIGRAPLPARSPACMAALRRYAIHTSCTSTTRRVRGRYSPRPPPALAHPEHRLRPHPHLAAGASCPCLTAREGPSWRGVQVQVGGEGIVEVTAHVSLGTGATCVNTGPAT